MASRATSGTCVRRRRRSVYLFIFGHRMRVVVRAPNIVALHSGVAGAARQKVRCRRLRKVARPLPQGVRGTAPKVGALKRRPKGQNTAKNEHFFPPLADDLTNVFFILLCDMFVFSKYCIFPPLFTVE